MDPHVSSGRSAQRFHWNLGGWLGTQLGGTIWMGILGVVLAEQGRVASGLTMFGGFAVVQLVGVALWRARERLSAHVGLQALIWTSAIATGIAFFVLDTLGDLGRLDNRIGDNPRMAYLFLLLFPALSVLFLAQDRAARASGEGRGA